MIRWRCSIWLLLACTFMPLPSGAQSPSTKNTVSVRELSIPAKAMHDFQHGIQLMAKGDPSGSLPCFQHAILEYSGFYEAYDRIGAADLKLWRLPEAEQAFQKAIDLSAGQFAHPLFALGAILDDRKDFAGALMLVRKGLGLEPDSWSGRYYLGLALLGLNRLEEAEGSAREALQRKADVPVVHLLLADIHTRKKDYPALVTDLNEYLRLAPNGPESDWARMVRDAAQRAILDSTTTTALAQALP